MKRLPILSLTAAALLCAIVFLAAITNWIIPPYGLAALAVLSLAAAIGDAVRLRTGSGAGQDGTHEMIAPQELDDEQLRAWLEDKIGTITSREQALNAQALALQQWMQFPDAMHFDPIAGQEKPRVDDPVRIDPMARHDEALFGLIETKTQQLFNDIKQDTYRKGDGETRTIDTQRIRNDLLAMVADVAAIYRPDEPNPLLQTNVEAISRATGRAALRFLVAIESLPGGIAAYDFRSIYNIVSRAVRTYGVYQSAKPYIDVASNVLFAGRIVSSTNPMTLAAWWAAGKAATYGASKLGQHVVDQQAVGLLRQLVEIVAIEVASLYSPMVRYRDVHWVYGVELVHLASELTLPPLSRLEIMSQISAIALRDEYARISLMKHAASGTSSRPDQYAPAESLAPAQCMAVAERLEAFLVAHVLKHGDADPKAVERWQTEIAERLEIQLRAGEIEVEAEEQLERCVWSLAAFVLEHLGDEPEDVLRRLETTKCWAMGDAPQQSGWKEQLVAEPPFLFHAPRIAPGTECCTAFLDDLVELASSKRRLDDVSEPPLGVCELVPWQGHEAIRVAAYFLRTDVKAYEERFRQAKMSRLLGPGDQASAALTQPGVLDAIEFLFGGKVLSCLYVDATFENDAGETTTKACVGVSGPTCVCFSVTSDGQTTRLTVHEVGEFEKVNREKIAGYVRSDCRLRFPRGGFATIAGSSLRGYDAYFAPLLS